MIVTSNLALPHLMDLLTLRDRCEGWNSYVDKAEFWYVDIFGIASFTYMTHSKSRESFFVRKIYNSGILMRQVQLGQRLQANINILWPILTSHTSRKSIICVKDYVFYQNLNYLLMKWWLQLPLGSYIL